MVIEILKSSASDFIFFIFCLKHSVGDFLCTIHVGCEGLDEVFWEGSVQVLDIGWSATLVKTWIWDPSFSNNRETKTRDARKGQNSH